MKNSIMDFEQVYIEYYPRIHRYLISLIGAKDAEDVTQEVFIKVGKALDTFCNESQLSTWLYRIATNAAVDRMREPSYRRETAVGLLELDESAPVTFAVNKGDISANPLPLEETTLRKATSECIRDIIENLPENYRVPVILSELEGLQNQEIAEILGLSLEVVKARLHRGKARLKKELLSACQFSRDERNELTCDPIEMVPEKAKK
jgi:RNA polymerase sigma-70 factor, ECF subfamily